MPLQTANQYQLGTDFSRLGSGIQQAQQIANQFQIGQQNKAIGERNTTKFDQEQSTIRATVLNKLATSMKTVPPEQRQAFLQNQAPELAKFNIDASVFAQEPLDDASLDEAIAGTKAFLSDKNLTAEQREFKAKSQQAGLTAEEISQAIKVDMGLVARAGESAAERIAKDDKLSLQVAESEKQKASAKETGKLEAQGKLLPKIRADIKLAETDAAGRGESLSTLNKAKAALPGLKEVVNRLKTLSEVATYSMGGRGWDTLVRETGFGSTEGATARSTMTAIVNNQVLPLLKDTFGSAFTEKEGESLKATILDVNLPPEQRSATLDAFIEQKARSIETMERELSSYPGVSEADIYETMKANDMTMEEVLEKLKGQTNGR